MIYVGGIPTMPGLKLAKTLSLFENRSPSLPFEIFLLMSCHGRANCHKIHKVEWEPCHSRFSQILLHSQKIKKSVHKHSYDL